MATNSISFDEEDIKLLKIGINSSPCIKCNPSVRMSCCGCKEEQIYENHIKEFKDRNIYDIALEEREIRNSILKLKDDIDKIKSKNMLLPTFLQKNLEEEIIKLLKE